MRNFFVILAITFIVIGFVFPPAWIAAVICGFLAVGCRPSGLRADGKKKTGGALGGIWDDIAVRRAMTECPYCKSQIMKTASKCPHCGEWVSKKQPVST